MTGFRVDIVGEIPWERVEEVEEETITEPDGTLVHRTTVRFTPPVEVRDGYSIEILGTKPREEVDSDTH